MLDVTLTVEQAIRGAEQGVLGVGRVSDPLCGNERENAIGQFWLHGGRSDDLAVVTFGLVSTDSLTSGSYSRLGYQQFVGPEDRFTDLMRSVYIPIQAQYSATGAGTVASTPTPET